LHTGHNNNNKQEYRLCLKEEVGVSTHITMLLKRANSITTMEKAIVTSYTSWLPVHIKVYPTITSLPQQYGML